MTGGPHLSSAVGAGERGWASGGGLGQLLGCCGLAALGCTGASRPRQIVGGAPADFRLLGHKLKRVRKGKAKGEENQRFEQLK
jgi:hypothetical protein